MKICLHIGKEVFLLWSKYNGSSNHINNPISVMFKQNEFLRNIERKFSDIGKQTIRYGQRNSEL